MPGKKHGKDSHFGLEDAGGVMRTISDFCDNIELDRSRDTADSTTIGLDDKTWLAGLRGASISLAGKWDSVATVGPQVVMTSLLGTEATATFEYGPEGNGTGAVKLSGECLVDKYQVSSPLEGVVKFTATCKVSGVVTPGTFA